MKTYVVQTTLPSLLRIRAEEFQFHSRDGILYFSVEGRRVAAFPIEAVVAVAEKPFGLGNVPVETETDWIDDDSV
ncbi:MAG: hypothetical protein PW734_03630 [Verrucomicrobium sp.]|nr:hypothetical protein [Verrucomicrobium sp.]